MNQELYLKTAAELVDLYSSSYVTSIDIAKSFIERTFAVEPKIHAWASWDPTYIETQANAIDLANKENAKSNLKRLLSVPVGIKDIFNTEYYTTEKGAPFWKNYRAGNDARCVAYLRREGGIIFGKTATAELAVHANSSTYNPYNIEYVTGTSSGGSAAAVACAMVPVALGSQTGGSIIRPASWCGVYGMKPSFGLIPRTGVLKTTDTLDTMGFFARSVQDLHLMLDTMRVRGGNFPLQESKLKTYSNQLETAKMWRIGFCNHPMMLDVDRFVKQKLNDLKNEFAQLKNIEVLELDLPKSAVPFQQLHRRIYHPCLAYYLKTEMDSEKTQISDTLKNIFTDAKSIPPEDYQVALKEQASLAADLEDFFVNNEIDVMLLPSSNGSAPHGKEPLHHLDLNQLWTMSWLPVVNIPKFKCQQNLPFGFQVIGPRYSDYKMLGFLEYLSQCGVIPLKTEVVCY